MAEQSGKAEANNVMYCDKKKNREESIDSHQN